MKTATCVCPTCGAVLDISCNSTKTVCKFCGNTIFISFGENSDEKDANEKPLFSSLVERKYIYYIPHFDGINDCYEFLLDYGEAVFLYNKNKEILSKDEIALVKEFFLDGHNYICNCTKKNLDSMIYSQISKYNYAFTVLNKEGLEFCDFKEMETITTNRLKSIPTSEKKEESADHAQNKINLVIGLIVLGIILLPGIISLIISIFFHGF